MVQGVIRRRLLVNFRVEAEVMQRFLPAPFRPKLHGGFAIAGICLIRLEQMRPAWLPGTWGVASENAAHRIAVVWEDAQGRDREGVYIVRRDTSSYFNYLTGGRIFPGEQHLADFSVKDDGSNIAMDIQARDGGMSLRLKACEASNVPHTSCFKDLSETSAFFEGGSVGYSVTSDCCRLDGMELQIEGWQVGALEVEQAESSFFNDVSVFPKGSAIFDHALIMRNIPHRWRQMEDMRLELRTRESLISLCIHQRQMQWDVREAGV